MFQQSQSRVKHSGKPLFKNDFRYSISSDFFNLKINPTLKFPCTHFQCVSQAEGLYSKSILCSQLSIFDLNSNRKLCLFVIVFEDIVNIAIGSKCEFFEMLSQFTLFG